AGVTGIGGLIDNQAPATHAVLTIGGTSSSTFAGTLQNSGAGASLELIKNNSGILTLTGWSQHGGGTLIGGGGVLQAGSGTDVAAVPSPLGTGPVTNNALLVLGSSYTVIISNAVRGT